MKKSRLLRWLVLATILIGVSVIYFLHIDSGPNYPSVHAICPVGGLENLWSWLAGHANLQKLFSGTMTLFFFTIIFAIIFGRAFCGNICPFGALQEFLGKISKKKINIPKNIDKYLLMLKYVVLVLVTVMAWITMTIWISPYDPYVAFSHIWSGSELFKENLVGFIILVIVVIGSVFIDRFFCKYLCPAGGLYAIASKISPTKIKREACTNCNVCTTKCPMNIDVAKAETVKSSECIACGECVSQCPSNKKPLSITFFGKKIKVATFVIITVVVFFGGLLILDAVGLYQVTVPSIAQVEKSGKHLKFVDLKGSMTIEDGAKYVGLSLEEFYKKMEIPNSVPKETRLKEISTLVPDYDFHAIKAKN